MNNMRDEQQELAKSLLQRCNVPDEVINTSNNNETLLFGLNVAFHASGEIAPDKNWLKEYYSITGDHMVLTEYGWLPADQNTFEATGEEPLEIRDEINAPTQEIK